MAFYEEYTVAPRISLTPKGSASAEIRYYVETTTNGFTIHFIDTPVSGNQYLFDYIIVQ